MLTLDKVEAHARTHPRVHIAPKVKVEAKTAAQKREVVEVTRRVISKHYAVLLALKDR